MPTRSDKRLLSSAALVKRGLASSLLVLLLFSFGWAEEPKTAQQREYELKAAFIYNFLRFVQWPPEKLPPLPPAKPDNSTSEQKTDPQPLIIGIVGKNPFGDAFEPILKKTIQNRTLQIKLFEGLSTFKEKNGTDNADHLEKYQTEYAQHARQCHLIFIALSEREELATLLTLLDGSQALTVSDIPTFAQNGGMIELVLEKNKIRFDINLTTAQKEQLGIRSELLELARKVYKNNLSEKGL